MFMPSAPSASAATRLRPSAMPPEATNGIASASAARGSRMKFGTSSSPGCPPHSKPSTLTASQPIFSAFSECRTEVHLWMTLTPCCFSSGIHCSGLRPAVSTIRTPPSTVAWISSAYGGFENVGRNVRFTPIGLSVSSRARRISAASFSCVPCVRPVMMPRPPAFETAAASSARPTKCMPPWMIGCSMPNSSVMRVFMDDRCSGGPWWPTPLLCVSALRRALPRGVQGIVCRNGRSSVPSAVTTRTTPSTERPEANTPLLAARRVQVVS